MCYKIMISGLNGTDIEFTVKILAGAARHKGYDTKIGINEISETRGDRVSCSLIFSKRGETVLNDEKPDALIALNRQALMRFGKDTAKVIITDEDNYRDYKPRTRIIRVNTDICNLGARFEGLKHMLMIGVWINQNNMIDAADVSAALSDRLNVRQAKISEDAMNYGMIKTHDQRMYIS